MEGGERGVGAWRWSLWWGVRRGFRSCWRLAFRLRLLLCCSQPAGRVCLFFVRGCCFAVRGLLVGLGSSSFAFWFCCCSQPAGQACFCFVCFRLIDIHSLLVRLVSPSEYLDLLFGEVVAFLHLHPPSPPLTSTLLHPLPCPPAYATSGLVTFRLLLCSSLVTIILFKLCPSSS